MNIDSLAIFQIPIISHLSFVKILGITRVNILVNEKYVLVNGAGGSLG